MKASVAKKQNKVKTFTDEEITQAIERYRGQADFLENLMFIYEKRVFAAQTLPPLPILTPPIAKKAPRLVSRVYRFFKNTLEKIGLLTFLKKTKLFNRLAQKGVIYYLNSGD